MAPSLLGPLWTTSNARWGVIYVDGHPILNRRCTRLSGCIRLQNDLYCVEWGVKLYSLTHSDSRGCISAVSVGDRSHLWTKDTKNRRNYFAKRRSTYSWPGWLRRCRHCGTDRRGTESRAVRRRSCTRLPSEFQSTFRRPQLAEPTSVQAPTTAALQHHPLLRLHV